MMFLIILLIPLSDTVSINGYIYIYIYIYYNKYNLSIVKKYLISLVAFIQMHIRYTQFKN